MKPPTSRNIRCLLHSLALLLIATGFAFAQAEVRPLVPSVLALLPAVALRGSGEMTFFGLTIYDCYFWAPAVGLFLPLPSGSVALVIWLAVMLAIVYSVQAGDDQPQCMGR